MAKNNAPETPTTSIPSPNDMSSIFEKLSQTLEIVANNSQKQIIIKTGGTELGFKAFKATYDQLRELANEEPQLSRVYHEMIRLMDRSRGSEFGMNFATTFSKDILSLVAEFPEEANTSLGSFTVLVIISSITARLDAQLNTSNNKGGGKHKNNNRNNAQGRKFANNDKNVTGDPKVIEAMKKLS